MRVEKEYSFQGIKTTLFYWNNKFLLKFEQAGFEQTYKFSELDYSIEEIENLLNDDFISRVDNIFRQMNELLR